MGIFSFLSNFFNNLFCRFSKPPQERELDLATLDSLIGTDVAEVSTRLIRQLSEDSFTVKMFRRGFLEFTTDENGNITGFEFTPPDRFEMTINGSSGDDVISVGDHDDTISGNDGNDIIDGNGGEDVIFGGDGNDTINGGNGSDIIDGGEGNDTIDGGEGHDVLMIDAALADFSFDFIDAITLEITDNNGLLGSDTVSNIEEFVFADGSYTQADLESLFNGPNVINGTSGNDTLYGTSGDDAIYGGAGNDTLYGDAGDDIINGNTGVDDLYGGSGADIFQFTNDGAISADTIRDFSIAEGDKLDISDLISQYDPLTDAIEDFVSITDVGSNSLVAIDPNGTGNANIAVAIIRDVNGLTDEQLLVDNGTLIT